MRENGFRAVGGLAQRLTSGIAKQRTKEGRGASVARLRSEWTAIVGAELARVTRPEALLSSRGARSGGAGGGKLLRLRVPGVAALEIQHKTQQLVERVNAYFGHRMIDDIRLVQGSIATQPAPPPTPAPDPRSVAEMAERAAAVKDPELRAALTRLGARIAARGVTGRRQILLGVLSGAIVMREAVSEARAQQAGAQDVSREKLMLMAPLPGDHVLGKPDAPNVLIDYASFTCPFCAQFYIAVLPVLQKEWIDSGKLKLVHRHFPMDVVATRASQLAECAGPDGFFAATERLFRTQVDWLSVGDPLVEMVKVLAGQGVTPDKAQACFANDRALDKVLADVQSGQTLGVRSTPALFINDAAYGNPGGVDAIAAILRQVGR